MHIELSQTGAIARITLNNPPKHNALSAQDIHDFLAALDQVANNADLRVLIVSSKGDKTFCAGAALDQMADGNMDGDTFEKLTDTIAALRLPTICAINGNVYGGGAEIALCCDFRIGIEGMRMFVPASRFGLCYPPNGIRRYVQTLGPDLAKRILMCAEEFSGEALLQIGYLSQLVSQDTLHAHAEQLAEQLEKLAPLAVQAMKELCNSAASGHIDHKHEQALAGQCQQSDDLAEGMRARVEKRTPVFHGR